MNKNLSILLVICLIVTVPLLLSACENINVNPVDEVLEENEEEVNDENDEDNDDPDDENDDDPDDENDDENDENDENDQEDDVEEFIEFAIQGSITDQDGEPVPGVEINFDGDEDFSSVSTGSDGNWHKSGLAGEVVVIPECEDHFFSPANITVTAEDEDDDIDFSAALKDDTYEVSGTIERTDGSPITGVEVEFSGDDIDEFIETTSNSGEYNRYGLVGEVTVEPVKEGYEFQPVSITVDDDRDDADFEAKYLTYSVAGEITDEDGYPVSDIELEFSGDGEFGSVRTGSDGSWEKTGLYGEVTVKPVDDDYVFSPANTTVTIADEDNDIDFAAALRDDTYEVSGTITSTDGSPITGVEVEFTGEDIEDFKVTTSSEGEYQRTGLAGEVTVEPDKEGYEFQPVSITVDDDRDDADFEATSND